MAFMNLIILLCLLVASRPVAPAAISDVSERSAIESNGIMALHFGFQTENGQQRSEDIKYNADSVNQESKNTSTERPVEYRGGYSFISADGYEYSVLYKANKNGFQPYVTAHKISKEKIESEVANANKTSKIESEVANVNKASKIESEDKDIIKTPKIESDAENVNTISKIESENVNKTLEIENEAANVNKTSINP